MSKRNNHRYVIPQQYVKDITGLQNGNEFRASMVGSYYASSAELSAGLQLVSEEDEPFCLIEADAETRATFGKAIPKKGTFGVTKAEVEQMRSASQKLGKCLIELPTEESIQESKENFEAEMTAMRDELNGIYYDVTLDSTSYNEYTGEFNTVPSDAKHGAYTSAEVDGMMNNYAQLAVVNQKVAERKYNLKAAYNCLPRRVNTPMGDKVITPAYPAEVVNGLKTYDKFRTAKSRLYVRVVVSLVHTIAIDNNYVYHHGDGVSPADLAAKYHYLVKGTSYAKGKALVTDILVPIQTMNQLKQVIDIVKRYYNKSFCLYGAASRIELDYQTVKKSSEESTTSN